MLRIVKGLPGDAENRTGGAEDGRERAKGCAFLQSDAVLPKGLPFGDGVEIAGLVILSGQIGCAPGTLDLVPGGIEAEARQTLENVRAVLVAHGMSLRDVVRVQVMLADMSEWQAFNVVYAEFFPPPHPARSAFGAAGLAFGARVEVEVMAVNPQIPAYQS